MAVETRPATRQGVKTVFVDRFCDGIIGPSTEMLGPVRDGGHIVANTAPGCWGPMITPAIRGGHEVTLPVEVEGAEVGDAVAIHIRDISVTSLATASGNDRMIEGRFNGDPYCAKVCESCGQEDEATVVEGIGPDSVRCANCGAPAAPFAFTNGYTIAFDDEWRVGVTVGKGRAEEIAGDADANAALPENSIQNPILLFAPHDLVGVATRLRPFMGQIGTTPAVDLPDSHNAGDFGAFLLGAPHSHAVDAEQLESRTDGHLDIDAARAGAVVIAPVKVPGAGIYMGDMHAMQGDGEIAGHTCDVSGTVTLQVEVLKGLDDRRPDHPAGRGGPAVPGPAADRRRADAGRGDRAPKRRRGARGLAPDLGGRDGPRPEQRRRRTASSGRRRCSTRPSPR